MRQAKQLHLGGKPAGRRVDGELELCRHEHIAPPEQRAEVARIHLREQAIGLEQRGAAEVPIFGVRKHRGVGVDAELHRLDGREWRFQLANTLLLPVALLRPTGTAASDENSPRSAVGTRDFIMVVVPSRRLGAQGAPKLVEAPERRL